MRISRALIFLGILFIPVFVSAANISNIAKNIIIEDELNIYRFRDNPGIWQRSNLNVQQITGLEKFNQSIFISYENDGQWILSETNNGLVFKERWRSFEEIDLLIFENKLLGVSDNSLVVIGSDLSQEEIDLPAHSYLSPGEYLASIGDDLLFFVERSDGIDVYELFTSVTNPKWSYSCIDTLFLLKPIPIVQCESRVIEFNPDPTELLADVEHLTSSDQMSFWKSLTDDNYYLYDGADITILNFVNVDIDDQFIVVAKRLFWQKNIGLFEIAWRSDPVSVNELPVSGDLRESDGGKLVILDDLTKLFYSKSYANWIETDISGSYEFLSTDQHLIAYLLAGSDAYYAVLDGQFIEMDSSWAASSKIRVLEETDDGLLLILRNSANNPNVYRSSDYENWTRVTMPKNPTILTDIITARGLPANTLVEIMAEISVLPGFVGSNISYIADSLAGMQIYLSRSKGVINISNYVEVTAIGKISSSAVGRVLLNSSEYLIPGARVTPDNIKTSISKAVSNIGNTHLIEGKLSNMAKDKAVVTDSSGSIKLHLDGMKEKFLADDVVLVEVVVDYNSSSKAVEAWWIGGQAKLISRQETSKEVEKNVAGTTKIKKISTPTKTSSSSGIVISTTPPLPMQTIEEESYEQVKVSGLTNNDQLPGWLTFLGGFMAGGLIIQGSRFKKFLK